jgi:hypothetical protein
LAADADAKIGIDPRRANIEVPKGIQKAAVFLFLAAGGKKAAVPEDAGI